MKIKDDTEKEVLWWTKCRRALHGVCSTGSRWRFLISLGINVVLVLIILAVFFLGLATMTESAEHLYVNTLYKMNIEPSSVSIAIQGIRSENIRIPGHIVEGWFASPDRISVDIKNNDFQWLSEERDKALSQGIWTGSNDTVPATIRYRDEKIQADVRLKGNSITHWGTDAWSLKVKTDGDDRFLGMKEFAIEKPVTRSYLTEWVFHRFLAYEHIPHLQFSYVDVTVNGKDMGIYAVEESPDDRLLEVEGFPPGPIFHMNDEIWQTRAAGYAIEDTPDVVPVEIYNANRYNTSERELQTRKGLDLFEAFRDGQISSTEAFDPQELATFMALSDLTGNLNGNFASNVKPFYNPVTAKLELIGNDAKSQPITTIFYLDDRHFNQRISNDTALVGLYVHELERVSEPGYLDRFFKDIDADFRQNLSFMYKENPFYHFPREIYDQNQNIIRQTIYPYRNQYSYLENSSDGVIYIEAGSAQPMPVEVLGLRLNGKLLPQASGPRILPGKYPDEVMNYHMLSFNLSQADHGTSTDNLTLECRVYGTTPVRSEPVIGRARLSDWPLTGDIVRRQPNPEQFSWLVRDDRNLTFTIQPGKWVIDNDLIIPKGYTVLSHQGGGTHLDLTGGSMILSYSPLRLTGDEHVPFDVSSSDGTGQGIVILNAGNDSFLSYVRISNLSVPDRNGWKLPGSVTFYQSQVHIDHCEFSGGDGPGSILAVVQGDAQISGSLFRGGNHDLLTSEYSSVEITSTRFLGPSITGIAGTGSTIAVLDTYFQGPMGIGVRGMRRSDITLGNSYFSDARVAGASEDGSVLTFNECSINAGLIGLAAYVNTPGYGPGTVVADNVQMVNTKTPYLSEKGSSIRIGGGGVPAAKSPVFGEIKTSAGISS